MKSCALVDECNDQAVTTDRDGQPLVVLCVHPAQATFVRYRYSNSITLSCIYIHHGKPWSSFHAQFHLPMASLGLFTSYEIYHLFSQNPATNTENSAQSRSEHIFMELTLFVYNINSQYFCIKSGLNYLRHKRYNRNETEGHISFCNWNFHRNGIYILYINCYHHRKIYILHW